MLRLKEIKEKQLKSLRVHCLLPRRAPAVS
jgi:hypothetical protein